MIDRSVPTHRATLLSQRCSLLCVHLMLAWALLLGSHAVPAQSAIASRLVTAQGRRLADDLKSVRTLADTAKAIAARYSVPGGRSIGFFAIDTFGIGNRQLRDTVTALASTIAKLRTLNPQIQEFQMLAQPSRDDTIRVVKDAVQSALAGTKKKEEPRMARWVIGGSPSLKLSGDGTLGSTLIASARATYFVPVAEGRSFVLPIVTNLSDLGSAADTSREEKSKKLLSSTEGAYLSIEPTWRALSNGGDDISVNFGVSFAAKMNTLQDSAKKDVTFTQFRFAPTVDIRIGRLTDEGPPILLTLRPVRSQYSKSAYKRLFGEARGFNHALETFLIVPIGGGTSVVLESTAGKRSAPVVRLGLFMQAAPKEPAAKE